MGGCHRAQVVPDALLLQFAAAEVHEAGGDVPAAKEVYEGLAAPLDGDREAGAPATPDAKDSAAAATAQVLACPACPVCCNMLHVPQRCALQTDDYRLQQQQHSHVEAQQLEHLLLWTAGPAGRRAAGGGVAGVGAVPALCQAHRGRARLPPGVRP